MSEIATLIKDLGIIAGVLIPVGVVIARLINGVRCLLRSEMLRIYYRHKDSEEMRQYELENFVFLYKAYKALKGNSFIDKINSEVMTWEVIS